MSIYSYKHHILPIFILSGISSYLLIPESNFPYLGISLAFSLIATTLYLYKPKTSLSHILLISHLLANLFLITRSQPFLTLINLSLSLYTLTLLLNPKYLTNFYQTLLSPLLALTQTLNTKNKLTLPSTTTKNNLIQHLPGLGITLILMCIIIPLLSSINPLFKELFHNTFNLPQLLESNLLNLLRLFIFGLLSFLLPKAISSVPQASSVQPNLIPAFNLLLPKIAISLILTIFFITQYQLHFQSNQRISNLQTTNSSVTNEIFLQLSLITFIIFMLIYNDKIRHQTNQLFTYLLITYGLLLEYIALNSLLDYTFRHGLTHKRVYGYFLLVWILGILIITSYSYVKKNIPHKVAMLITLLTITTILSLSIVNIEALILKNPPRLVSTSSTPDQDYLISNLNYDTNYLAQELHNITHNYQYVNSTDINQYMHLLFRLSALQTSYASLDLHSFNVGHYQSYQQIKHLNLSKLRDQLHHFQESNNYQSIPNENLIINN